MPMQGTVLKIHSVEWHAKSIHVQPTPKIADELLQDSQLIIIIERLSIEFCGSVQGFFIHTMRKTAVIYQVLGKTLHRIPQLLEVIHKTPILPSSLWKNVVKPTCKQLGEQQSLLKIFLIVFHSLGDLIIVLSSRCSILQVNVNHLRRSPHIKRPECTGKMRNELQHRTPFMRMEKGQCVSPDAFGVGKVVVLPAGAFEAVGASIGRVDLPAELSPVHSHVMIHQQIDGTRLTDSWEDKMAGPDTKMFTRRGNYSVKSQKTKVQDFV